jgi:flagellar biosynthetic protein FliQ
MTPQTVVEILRQALMTTFWLSLPLLAIGLIAGVLVSLLQILTSIQDPAFGSVPRLAAFLGAIFILLPWMITRLMTYTTSILGGLEHYAR